MTPEQLRKMLFDVRTPDGRASVSSGVLESCGLGHIVCVESEGRYIGASTEPEKLKQFIFSLGKYVWADLDHITGKLQLKWH